MAEADEPRLMAVERKFGIKLRDHQVSALSALGRGKNVILHSPTGSGKSLVFQAAPEVLPNPGIMVVLYPLRALVKDQTRRAEELGLPSVTIYGDTRTIDRPAVYEKIRAGEATMVFTTPESFDRNRKLQEALRSRGVNLLVVDEAHAYEEWADGFRPTYRNAGVIADKVGVKQFLLCSATLTATGYKNAVSTLRRSDWEIVQVPPLRPNLVYRDLSEPASEILARAIRGTGLKPPGIVFFTTVRNLEDTAAAIKRATKCDILRYHGGMTAKTRREAQEAFMVEDRWLFATKAFGMGIDKPNIRNIIHMQMPSSVLSYAQECGRAGRDGEESTCFLTQSETGESARFLVDMSVPSPERVELVWSALLSLSYESPTGWFTVDWDDVCSQTQLSTQAVSACIGWLFTGRMIEKQKKQTNLRFVFDGETDDKARAYKRGAPEVIELLRAEASLEEGGGEFELKLDELDELVGHIAVDWRGKLRRLAERGIFQLVEPVRGKANYRFLHKEFVFARGAEQLRNARDAAFSRLSDMRQLQRTPAHRRKEVMEQAITLNLGDLEEAKVEPTGNDVDDSSEIVY